MSTLYPLHSCRKWVPHMPTVYCSASAGSGVPPHVSTLSCTSPTGSGVPHPVSTAYPHRSHRKYALLSRVTVPTVKLNPPPPQSSGLSWRSGLTHRRAPHAAPPHPRRTACRLHTGFPSARVLGPRLLEGNDERRRLHRKSMINLDVICCVPLRVTC